MIWNVGSTRLQSCLRHAALGVTAFAFMLMNNQIYARDDVQLSGFMTAGVSHADKKITKLQQLYNIDDKMNFLSDSVIGIQMDYRFDNKTKTSVQLIASDRNDHYGVDVEWAYVSYLINPNLSVRAGRLRLPLFSMSETIYVGRSYVWVRPPPEVYSIFTTLTHYNGFDALYDIDFGDGIFTVQPFIGQAKETISISTTESEVDTDGLAGIVLNYALSNLNFRFNYTDSTFVASPDTIAESKTDVTFANLGLDYSLSALQLKAELAKIELDSEVTENTEIIGSYITAAYAIEKFTPYLTYGLNKADSVQDSVDSDSVTLGVRMESTNSISTKFEVFRGVAGDFFTYTATGDKELAGIDEDVTIISLVFNLDF